jgi:hypothetical protein
MTIGDQLTVVLRGNGCGHFFKTKPNVSPVAIVYLRVSPLFLRSISIIFFRPWSSVAAAPSRLFFFLFLATLFLLAGFLCCVSYSSLARIWSKRPFVSYRPMTLPLWPTVSLL